MFPLLRPALNNFYLKISGKCAPNRYIRINNAVHSDLTWAAHHLEQNSGIWLIHQIRWDASADFTVYCDACLEGMGFWLPDKCISFYSPVPDGLTDEQIFYFVALCVLSAIHHISNIHQPPQFSCLLIYTDNDNTVTIFNTLQCLPQYNNILISTADTLIKGNLNLHILHIPGELNYVADAISRKKFNLAQHHVPGSTISTFSPPHLLLGAAKK